MFAIFEKVESQALFAIFEHKACQLACTQPPALGIGRHPPLDRTELASGSGVEAGLSCIAERAATRCSATDALMRCRSQVPTRLGS